MRHIRPLLLLALLAAPATAAADYLYAAFQDETKPYVMLIVDSSGSMTSTDSGGTDCPYGGSPGACKSRGDAVRDAFLELVGRLDGAGVGLLHFANTPLATCADKGCGVTWVASPDGSSRDSTREQRIVIAEALSSLTGGGNSAIALSLQDAKTRLADIAKEDLYFGCRKYYVILLADDEDTCCGSPATVATELRSVPVTGKENLEVRTFVVGLGRQSTTTKEALSVIARNGGTARTDAGWQCWDPEGGTSSSSCTDGSAMFATDAASLRSSLDMVMSAIQSGIYTTMAPVIGTAPQVPSEVDAVARNFMVFTAFKNPGYEGHVYGLRLFEEEKDEAGKRLGTWQFTDFATMNLSRCGEAGNPCTFDAGKRLYDRVHSTGNPRKIFTADPVLPAKRWDENGAATLNTRKGTTLAMSRDPVWLTDDDTGAARLRSSWIKFTTVDPIDDILMNSVAELTPIHRDAPARLAKLASSVDASGRRTILGWLHGRSTLRSWPLGDPYHAGAAMAEPPPYQYQTFGYQEFKKTLRARPHMVYVPANDGMIHAFHGSPDLEMMRQAGREEPTCTSPERWCAGDEAWAYLPVNLIGRTAFEVLGGAQRFFSMDLSCRIDDMLVVDNRASSGTGTDCTKDTADRALCGWRTVLLCGQGWGGSWYTALDVSRPLSPRPLWELTFDDGANGFGRTWSLPGIALLQINGLPRWVAVGGNGYNTDISDGNGRRYMAYRYLNLPFAGPFAFHGNGSAGDVGNVYAFDVASGQILRRFVTSDPRASDPSKTGLGSIVADVPAVDVDRDGFTEVAYVGGWSGDIGRVAFGGESRAKASALPASWSYCPKLFSFGGGQPVPNRPAVMLDPQADERVYLIAASGRDKGTYPDESKNDPASYALDGWYFTDTGGTDCAACTASGGNGNMCVLGADRMNGLFTGANAKRRLMGAPILAGQSDGSRWLSFTTWDPPTAACHKDGKGALYCLEFSTNPASCNECGDLDGDGSTTTRDRSIVFSDQIPPPPNSADGQIYVVNDGVIRVANQDGTGGGVGGGTARPNQQAPRRLIVSWREVFPSP